MADTLPIPTRSGIAREPLDPTTVVLGPQPLDFSGRDGHHVIVGEVVKPGRHRAARPRRRIAVSGAVLSAAGAFVTLALMMSNHTTSTSAGPRVAPSTPVPDLPEEPTVSQSAAHTAQPTVPVHAAVPAAVHTTTRHTVSSPRGFSANDASQQMRRAAARMRKAESEWASAMSRYQASPSSGYQEQAGQASQDGSQSWQRGDGGGRHREDGAWR